MIYTLLLPSGKAVDIFHGKLSELTMQRSSSTEVAMYRGLVRLLRTGRQIHEEAAQLAYGAVTFEFFIDLATLQCFRNMGSMKRHIRKIEIRVISATHFRAILHQLKQAQQLQQFSFTSYAQAGGYQGAWTGQQTAQALGPFVKFLNKSRGSEEARQEIPQIFCAKPDQYIYERNEEEQVTELKRARRWEKALRDGVTATLS